MNRPGPAGRQLLRIRDGNEFKLRQERNMPPRRGWGMGWRGWLQRFRSGRSDGKLQRTKILAPLHSLPLFGLPNLHALREFPEKQHLLFLRLMIGFPFAQKEHKSNRAKTHQE